MMMRWLVLFASFKEVRLLRLWMISERVIPQYVHTVKVFEPRGQCIEAPRRSNTVPVTSYVKCTNLHGDQTGYLISHSDKPLFENSELDAIIAECEQKAFNIGGWTTRRHANYPTTDIPLAELPQTLDWFRNNALPSVVYPFLGQCFGFVLPDPSALRCVDAFVVKYNATGGQCELKPHRDGSVLSFNIALNSLSEYEGGGTWFDGIQTSIRSDKGHLLTHASGLLHGGHPITSGVRYILVAFVILRSYPNFASRFYEFVRDR